jgi:hypothetical protein
MKKPKGAVKCKMVAGRGGKRVKRCWDKKGKFVKAGKK